MFSNTMSGAGVRLGGSVQELKPEIRIKYMREERRAGVIEMQNIWHCNLAKVELKSWFSTTATAVPSTSIALLSGMLCNSDRKSVV